jgi:hypothetical protein
MMMSSIPDPFTTTLVIPSGLIPAASHNLLESFVTHRVAHASEAAILPSGWFCCCVSDVHSLVFVFNGLRSHKHDYHFLPDCPETNDLPIMLG